MGALCKSSGSGETLDRLFELGAITYSFRIRQSSTKSQYFVDQNVCTYQVCDKTNSHILAWLFTRTCQRTVVIWLEG